MSRVTCINVLLDTRFYGRQSDGMDYALNHLRRRLEQRNGIELYFLSDNSLENDFVKHKMNADDYNIMHMDSDFDDIDVFISSAIDVPDVIRNRVEITKYAVIDKFLSCIYGTNGDWYEEKIRKYQDGYDFFLTFSEKIKDYYLEKTTAINPDRIFYLPLKYEADEMPGLESAKRYFQDDKKYCLVFYRNDYDKEITALAKGFLKFLADNQTCDLVFALAYLGDQAWGYKKIACLFEGYEDNIVVVNGSSERDRHDLISEADAYLDIFYLEDINITLLEELSYGKYIVSNSLITEGRNIIKAKNSIVSFCEAIQKLHTYLHAANMEVQEQEAYPALEENSIFEFLFEVENRKQEKPLVTIVTITYNLIDAGRKDSIRQCIRSVHNQTYPNIEHIIIDGASFDGTLKLLENYRKRGWIDVFSEPDDGLYDAMNKGIHRAEGKYIAFLNSDDFYHDTCGVEKTVCALQKLQADYAFSDTNILNEDGSIYYWAADIRNILYARNYCHQSMFTRLHVMKELNGFDLNYRVSADSDLMIRLYNREYTYVNVPYCFVTYRGGGLSAAAAEESRRDHAYSFFVHLGHKYSLTHFECYELWQYRFFDELSKGHQFRLIAKIPECFNAEMIMHEYMKRRPSEEGLGRQIKNLIAQRVSFNGFWLSRNLRIRNGKQEMIYYFCKILPIWITKEK